MYGIVPIERRRHDSRITHGNLVFNDDICCWMARNCREHQQAGIMTPCQTENDMRTPTPLNHYDDNIRRMLVDLAQRVDELHAYVTAKSYEGRYVAIQDLIATLGKWMEQGEAKPWKSKST